MLIIEWLERLEDDRFMCLVRCILFRCCCCTLMFFDNFDGFKGFFFEKLLLLVWGFLWDFFVLSLIFFIFLFLFFICLGRLMRSLRLGLLLVFEFEWEWECFDLWDLWWWFFLCFECLLFDFMREWWIDSFIGGIFWFLRDEGVLLCFLEFLFFGWWVLIFSLSGDDFFCVKLFFVFSFIFKLEFLLGFEVWRKFLEMLSWVCFDLLLLRGLDLILVL